jgi:hypothetical protein
MEDAEALRKRLATLQPDIGKLSKKVQARIHMNDGTIEFVEARYFLVMPATWGNGPAVMLGVYKGLLWRIFDWHTGADIGTFWERARKDVIRHAVEELELQGREKYNAAVAKIHAKYGEENLN